MQWSSKLLKSFKYLQLERHSRYCRGPDWTYCWKASQHFHKKLCTQEIWSCIDLSSNVAVQVKSKLFDSVIHLARECLISPQNIQIRQEWRHIAICWTFSQSPNHQRGQRDCKCWKIMMWWDQDCRCCHKPYIIKQIIVFSTAALLWKRFRKLSAALAAAKCSFTPEPVELDLWLQ